MGEIRRFEEAHIPEVAALELKTFHGISQRPPDALLQYFRAIFFENPWRDDEIPPLVYIHNDKIAGFLGVIPRHMRFRGQLIRVAATSQLMVDRDHYRGFAGLELMRRLFSGPQEFSYVDGGTEDAYTIWTAAGGQVLPVYGLRWRRVLRPARYLQSALALSRNAKLKAAGTIVSPLCKAADAIASRLPYRAFQHPRSALHPAPADSDQLFDCLQEIGWREELQPAYERDSFRWLLRQAATATAHGELRVMTLRDNNGRYAGSFVYYLKRNGLSNVLQIASRARNITDVLLALFRNAYDEGAAALMGQAMPKYLLQFNRSYCEFVYPCNGVIMHSRNRDIADCLLRGDAALSFLDGEWWTRFVSTRWLETAEPNQAATGKLERSAVLR